MLCKQTEVQKEVLPEGTNKGHFQKSKLAGQSVQHLEHLERFIRQIFAECPPCAQAFEKEGENQGPFPWGADGCDHSGGQCLGVPTAPPLV